MIDGFCDNLLAFAYTRCVGAQLQKQNSSWLCRSWSSFDALMNRFAKWKFAYIEYVLVNQVYKSEYSLSGLLVPFLMLILCFFS